MRLQDFLNMTEWFDGEIITSCGLESKFSFCWDNDTKITKAGKSKFKPLLQSKIKLHTNNDLVVITLLNEANEDLEEIYDLFMGAVAGYVPTKLYDKWFEVKK